MHPHKIHCFFDDEALKEVRSIAVLPFHNVSKEANAGIIMTNMLMAELVEHGFRVVKYGDMRQFFLSKPVSNLKSLLLIRIRQTKQLIFVKNILYDY